MKPREFRRLVQRLDRDLTWRRRELTTLKFLVDGGVLNQSQGGMCICRVLGIGAGVSRECFGP